MSWDKPDLPYNDLPSLPPRVELESGKILKKAIEANKYLAELKGYSQTLPDPKLLINTIVLQESQDSSAIENIVTTQDELYQALLFPFDEISPSAKEVIRYREAVYAGLKEMKRGDAITGKLAIHIMQKIKDTSTEYRGIPGTKLKNPNSGKIIFTPPDPNTVAEKMSDWEKFINLNKSLDSLIVMALMHYQFETIHPFSDGNGRTGRILNVLFLVNKNLLTLPVLYHSRYIIQHKADYYNCLREVTENDKWEQWILFMLDAVQQTSASTLQLITGISNLKNQTLEKVRTISQKLPAYELNEMLFSFPYIKINTLIDKKLGSRPTVTGYLNHLVDKDILRSQKIGREIYFINHGLMKLLRKTDM